ncbi:hypothetical protein AB7M42_004000 [Bradyrhizobium diazoefficiens]|uniref:Uncharacterized protein n=1 Tax=Bradyrhizobium diazoefficiens TaxID=1355477 RepID=A0A809YKN2_9BRAD|nr:hypothetical protein [Bradyrhizobium japonicum]BBZ94500.1 hypothetical protein F07S3_43330 [Bradyrhizobium diazoefficiens]BCA03478.1 hypothetical protein H12S4_43820 [Bradyrhizobium diazoefficiens]BCA12182.1 hypothetical protein BDHF08_40290 [Bradyrhizobium diazoefficiens]BCA20840.1 hypothetical protein BDHH15_40550 [Bradyrhizobium diazoefficiens]
MAMNGMSDQYHQAYHNRGTRHPPIGGCAGRADGARPAGVAFKPPGLMPAQNATRTPPLAVPVRLWSDIIMPSTAPNTDTLRLVR